MTVPTDPGDSPLPPTFDIPTDPGDSPLPPTFDIPTDPGDSPLPPTFERLGEYQAALDNVIQTSARRQHTHALFLGLNTLFLTALGFLLISTHLDSWWLVAAVGAITVAILPINISWRLSLARYRDQLNLAFSYIREIEAEFSARRAISANSESVIGLFTRLHSKHPPGTGNTRLEMRLASYFIWLYPLIAAVVAGLTYLVTNKYLPPFDVR